MRQQKPQGVQFNIEDIAYYERNLLDHPFCVFSTQDAKRLLTHGSDSHRLKSAPRQLILRQNFADEDTQTAHEWIVKGDAIRGFPSGFDQDVLLTVKKLIADYIAVYDMLPRYLPLPSDRAACRMMQKTDKNGTLVTESYKRWASTVFETTAYFVKDQAGSVVPTRQLQGRKEVIFTLWDYVAEGEQLPDGSFAEERYLALHDPFMESLKTFHLRPFDYNYHMSLSPLAKRICSLQGLKFYGLRNSRYTREKYEEYCARLPLVPRRYLSKAKESFARAHNCLLHDGYFSKIEWVKPSRQKGIMDWEIRYYPGPLAIKEIEASKKRTSSSSTKRSWTKEQLIDINAWKLELIRELDNEDESNTGYYVKIGRLIASNRISADKVRYALGLAREVQQYGEVRENLSAVFTDELRRLVGVSEDEFRSLLRSV